MRLALPRFLALVALACAALSATAEAKVSSSVSSNGILTIQSGRHADRAAVSCSAEGIVKVNGRDPRGGAVGCGKVTEVDAVMGRGNDRVNFSGVQGGFGTKDFPGFGQGTGAAALMGPGDDTYIGSPSAFNLFFGGAGDDSATGGPARDSMMGGAGNDGLNARGGNDVLLGNADADTLIGGPDDDLISGNAGNDLLNGGAGTDLIGGGLGIDRLLGGPGPDRLIGGAGKDRLNGGGGNNEIFQDGPKKKP